MKRVYCVLGLPGAGKTTAVSLMSRLLGCPKFHVPDVVGHHLSPSVRSTLRWYARLFPRRLDPLFLEAVAADKGEIALLDGYPPTASHLRTLDAFAKKHGWTLEIVFMSLPGIGGLFRSFSRQVLRDLREKRGALQRIPWKVLRAALTTPPVIRTAQGMGIVVHTLRATADSSDVEDQIREVLNLRLDTLPWEIEPLRMVAEIAPEAWVTGGGHAYKPFFNGVFGPALGGYDVDIRVWGVDREKEVQRLLEQRAPYFRWHVKDAQSWGINDVGRKFSCLEDALGAMCLICTCVGIRWRQGRVEVHFGHPEAEGDLRKGLLRPNLQGQIAFAHDKAKKIAMYYPGVSAPFLNHQGQTIARDVQTTFEQLHDFERGGRRRWQTLIEQECQQARSILRMRESLPKLPQLIPWPRVCAPPMEDPWLSSDNQFRMWVVNQTRSRNPLGGRDSYLCHALDCQRGVAQKPLHQGWSLHLHALHALLELRTDDLPEYRRPLRLAMLWHDIGKLHGIRTPGAHPLIGAKVWREKQRDAFPGVTHEEEEFISFLIANHDVFGRLERGLWDGRYQGGMDPQAVRASLAHPSLPLLLTVRMAKAMWKADVGSVALLRWLLPLADPLEQLVLCGERE